MKGFVKRFGPVALVAAALLLLLGVGGDDKAYDVFATGSDTEGCSPQRVFPAPTPEEVSSAPADKPALNLIPGERTSLAFGRTRTFRILRINLELENPLPVQKTNLEVQLDDIRRSDDARISDERIKIGAQAANGVVTLVVCVDRTQDKYADPGRYEGNVIFSDPRILPATVPITVTVAYPHARLAALVFIPVVLVAGWYVWALKGNVPGDHRALSREGLGACVSWYRTVCGLTALGAGVAAAVAVFGASYLENPTWGSSSTDVITLFGAMFGAFVAGATIVQGQASTPAQRSPRAE